MRIGMFVLLLALWSCNATETNTIENNRETEALSALNTPFEQVQVGYHEFQIDDLAQASSFEVPGGTRIELPAHAFVHEDGSPVTGPVVLRYREFHEAASIVASGIPMRCYDDQGDEGWLQTAGMFEFRAQSEGRPLQVAEGQSVALDFASRVDGDYDFWYFDEAAENWDNLGAGAQPIPDGEASEALSEEVRLLQRQTQRPPMDPDAPETHKLVFLDLDVSRVPQLQGQKTVLLAYAGGEESELPANNEWIRKATWLRKNLEPTTRDGVYQLTLAGEQRYSVPVRILPQGKEMEAAKARYVEQMEIYQRNLALLADRQADLQQQQRFRRLVQLQTTGIYNYDILLKLRNAVPILANFQFGDLPEALKDRVTVYLITADNRSAIAFGPGEWSRFQFLPEQQNMLLAVLPGDKVAYFSVNDFKNAEAKLKASQGQEYTFRMKVKEQAIQSVEDLRQLIDIAI